MVTVVCMVRFSPPDAATHHLRACFPHMFYPQIIFGHASSAQTNHANHTNHGGRGSRRLVGVHPVAVEVLTSPHRSATLRADLEAALGALVTGHNLIKPHIADQGIGGSKPGADLPKPSIPMTPAAMAAASTPPTF